MSKDQFRRRYERLFPPGMRLEYRGGGIAIHVPCKHEGCQPEPMVFRMRMPPDKARAHMANNGWRFWGKSTLCPEHAKGSQQQNKETGMEVPNEVVAAVPANQNEPSASAREAKRLGLMLLDDKFDVVKGCYRDGYSDEKAAREVGLSGIALAKLREEFYGPIKEPAEIAEWRAEIAAIDGKIDKLVAELKALRGGVDATVSALKADLRSLSSRIDTTVRRNGW